MGVDRGTISRAPETTFAFSEGDLDVRLAVNRTPRAAAPSLRLAMSTRRGAGLQRLVALEMALGVAPLRTAARFGIEALIA
jgi:hypothetical protein